MSAGETELRRGPFSNRFLTRLGQLWAGLTLLLIGATLVLTQWNGYPLSVQTFLISVAMAAVMSAVIITRRPRLNLGWFIAAFAFCFALGEFSRQYVTYGAFRSAGVLPALSLLAIPVYFIWYPGLIFVLVLLPLYYPNGQLLSLRWRPVVWLTVCGTVVGSLIGALRPRADEIPGYPNPLGVGVLLAPPDVIAALFFVLQLSWFVLGLIAAASLFLRYRRASLQAQQQIKWFLFALGGVLGYSLFQSILQLPLPEVVGELVFAVLLASLWVAIAIAILRYRLFDIDLIIRRTLTYAIVAVFLATVYFGSVLLLQQLFAALTGQRSEVITVLSTLAIAALFVPVRNWVQNVIDRRFNRKKYNAQQVLADFGQTVRDETDLDALAGRLIEVVNETMQPKTVSLWLKRK